VRRALLDPARDDPLYVLAERLGFSDAPHLSRLFRARYGLTPSAWRARAGRTGRIESRTGKGGTQ
jgi:AraC-like DNA-binding protein